MEAHGTAATPDTLIEALREVGNDRVGAIAVLWTWLERHLIPLGSLREKPPEITRAARDAPSFEGIDEDLLAWLARSPLRNAAELLARIARRMEQVRVPLTVLRPGFDHEEVVVSWRRSELVARMRAEDYPPSAIEHPSLTTLAPTLIVSPRVANGIELTAMRPSGPAWELAERLLQQGLDEGDRGLTIHLDTLGQHGMSGWDGAYGRGVGIYDPERVDAEDETRCVEAARRAVREAAGPSSILVLPELAATPAVLNAIGEQLAAEREPPALTVVGLYHHRCAGGKTLLSLAGGEDLAHCVNEAIVLGPDGKELWRHRKLSCAGGAMSDDEPSLMEDIHLGDKMTVVSTPLGNVAVVICLDAFAPHVRDRLAKSPASVLLVPSLSPEVLRHRDSLQHLVQLIWGVAFVCNRSPHAERDGADAWNAERSRSFWVEQRAPLELPAEKAPGEHPSFVFRLDGGDTGGADTGKSVEDRANVQP